MKCVKALGFYRPFCSKHYNAWGTGCLCTMIRPPCTHKYCARIHKAYSLELFVRQLAYIFRVETFDIYYRRSHGGGECVPQYNGFEFQDSSLRVIESNKCHNGRRWRVEGREKLFSFLHSLPKSVRPIPGWYLYTYRAYPPRRGGALIRRVK